jgi:flavoprotein
MYVRNTIPDLPLIFWSPAAGESCLQPFASPQDLQKSYPDFESHSRYYRDYNGPLFKSGELGNYELMKMSPAATSAGNVPDGIRKLLGRSKKEMSYIGAYPALP